MKSIKNFIETFDHNNLSMKDDHELIWDIAYRPTQIIKSTTNNLTPEQQTLAFNTLIKRGIFIKELFSYFECKNFAEVGTAEGYQFYVMSNHQSTNKIDGVSYSCDIRDARSKDFVEKYNSVFVHGNSKDMANRILQDERKIDLFWIDGNHSKGAVLYDVIRLSKTQNKNCVWVFDDYNRRFGAYNEIKFLSKFSESYNIDMGITASGMPNSIMILQGCL